MESALVLAPQSTSSTAEWSATPGTGRRASRPGTGSSTTSSSPGIFMSTTRTRSWAAPSRSSSVQVCKSDQILHKDINIHPLQAAQVLYPSTGIRTGPLPTPASWSTTRQPTTPSWTASISTVSRRTSKSQSDEERGDFVSLLIILVSSIVSYQF